MRRGDLGEDSGKVPENSATQEDRVVPPRRVWDADSESGARSLGGHARPRRGGPQAPPRRIQWLFGRVGSSSRYCSTSCRCLASSTEVRISFPAASSATSTTVPFNWAMACLV